MARILLVEDCRRRRRAVERFLAKRGHQVKSVDEGRAAIDMGAAYRPDFVIARWMLPGFLNGLQVCEALRLVEPRTRGVLYTSYPSADLRDSAEAAGLEPLPSRPPSPPQLLKRISARALRRPSTNTASLVSVVEVAANGQLLHANPSALHDLQLDPARLAETRLHQVFFGSRLNLYSAVETWIEVTAAATGDLWRLRSRYLQQSQTWIVVLCRREQPEREHYPATRILLELPEANQQSWPFPGRALVAAEDPLVRSLLSRTLWSLGCKCHSYDDPSAALDTFQRDHQINTVLLADPYGLPGWKQMPSQLRTVRPDALIVQLGARQHHHPWSKNATTPTGLLHAVVQDLSVGCLGACAGCGAPVLLEYAAETLGAAPACHCLERQHEVPPWCIF